MNLTQSCHNSGSLSTPTMHGPHLGLALVTSTSITEIYRCFLPGNHRWKRMELPSAQEMQETGCL